MRSEEFLKLDSCDGRGVVLEPPIVVLVTATEEPALVAVFSFFSLPP